MYRRYCVRWVGLVVVAAGLVSLLAGCNRAALMDAHHNHNHASDVYVGDVKATPADAVESVDFVEAELALKTTGPQPALRKWPCTTTVPP